MSYDDLFLPTNRKRRSIFDDHNDAQSKNETVKLNFPVDNSITNYPVEYIDKVRTEIELWKMHITKILEGKQKFKAEKLKLKNTVVDENILSSQQHEIIASFNTEEYIRRMKMFFDRVAIIAHQCQYKTNNDIEQRYLVTQKNIEEQFVAKCNTDIFSSKS